MAERFHWTLDEISKLPYKWIQRFYAFQRAKNSGVDDRRAVNDNKNASKPGQKGQRQIITDPSKLVRSNRTTPPNAPDKKVVPKKGDKK